MAVRVFDIAPIPALTTPTVETSSEEIAMSIGTIVLIVVVLLLIGVIPTWPHSRGWGYGPSGGLGVVVVILLVLFLLGKI